LEEFTRRLLLAGQRPFVSIPDRPLTVPS